MTDDVNDASLSDALPGGPEGVAVVRRIGSGAAGTVYEVRRTGEERSYALKVPAESPHGIQIRRREAEALQSLRHDHLVEMYGWASSEAGVGLLMEYLPDGTAQRLVAGNGPLPPGEVVTLVAPIASALAFLHEQGAAHGDVSPGNVLFTAEGRPKLAELGFAALLGRSGIRTQHRGFTAPEVRDGTQDRSDADERSADVYALGALTWFALTGQAPGEGAERMPLPGLREEASDLLEQALARDPARRPSAEDFWLGIFAAGEPRPLNLAATADETAAAAEPAPVPRTPAEPPRARPARRSGPPRPVGQRSTKRGLWLAGALAVLLAAGIGWVVASGALTPEETNDVNPGGNAATDSSAPAAEPSEPATASDGIADVLQGLAERRSEALTQLSPELLTEVYATEEAAADDRQVIDDLVSQGRRYDGLTITMSDAELLSEDGGERSVRVLSRILPYSVVDESGAPVEETTEAKEENLVLQLQNTPDGWRIASVESVPER